MSKNILAAMLSIAAVTAISAAASTTALAGDNDLYYGKKYYLADYEQCDYRRQRDQIMVKLNFYGKPARNSSSNYYDGEEWKLPSETGDHKLTNYDPENDGICTTITPFEIWAENHTPTASFNIVQENKWGGGTNRVTFTSTSFDRDEGYSASLVPGKILKYEWKVNGVVKSNSNTLIMYTQHGGEFDVKLTVWDSGIKAFHPYRDGWLNNAEPFFKLKNSVEKTVTLSEWNCDRRCTIY